MKAIHEAVQKELELQRMLNHAVREKEAGLRELQKVLLQALYLVNRLLDEIPAEGAARIADSDESPELEPAESKPAEADAAVAEPRGMVSPESEDAISDDSSPRDLP